MKPFLALPLLFACLMPFLFGGCASDNPNPSPTPAPISSTTLALIQTGASVATGAVLNYAVTQPSTRTRLANEIYSAANGIYTLTGGTLPTPQQLSSTLVAWGQSGDAQYTQFSSSLSALYATYYAKYVAGNLTASDIFQVLNAIASGAESATQGYVTVPTPPVPGSATGTAINLINCRHLRAI